MNAVNPIIDKLIKHIEAECSAVDQNAVFDEMLDECYSFDAVGGPFAQMSPSRVLREVDPVAYRCGVNDHFGTDDSYIEVGGETYRKYEVDAAVESFTEDLDNEATDLETEIEKMEADEDRGIWELDLKQRQLLDLQADIKAVKEYSL